MKFKVKITPSDFKSLAPMPATVSRLTTLMYDVHASTSDITRLIELDAALTANVLRWANSAYFGARVKIASVKAAVVRMGVNNIIRLSVGDCLASTMKRPLPVYGLAENGLWRHNLAAALTAESLEQVTGMPSHPAAFTAALLHDVGKSILGMRLDAGDAVEIQRLIAEGAASTDAERRLLDTDHAEVGAAMASYWKFPDELIQAIEKHHDLEADPDPLHDAVKTADAVAKQIESRPISEAYESILFRRGLTPDRIGALCAAVAETMRRIEEEWTRGDFG